jgi:DNA-binding protein Fis
MGDSPDSKENTKLYQSLEIKLDSIAEKILISKVSYKENIILEVQRIIERIFVNTAMKVSKNNISKAAKLLGINRNTLSKKIKEYQKKKS